jgi:hypothetical protein
MTKPPVLVGFDPLGLFVAAARVPGNLQALRDVGVKDEGGPHAGGSPVAAEPVGRPDHREEHIGMQPGHHLPPEMFGRADLGRPPVVEAGQGHGGLPPPVAVACGGGGVAGRRFRPGQRGGGRGVQVLAAVWRPSSVHGGLVDDDLFPVGVEQVQPSRPVPSGVVQVAGHRRGGRVGDADAEDPLTGPGGALADGVEVRPAVGEHPVGEPAGLCLCLVSPEVPQGRDHVAGPRGAGHRHGGVAVPVGGQFPQQAAGCGRVWSPARRDAGDDVAGVQAH